MRRLSNIDVLWGPLYWEEDKQDIEVQTDIVKYELKLWRICLVDKKC